jgi:phosphoribosyl 1,2-cyclic phosphodiesterase
MALFISSLNSGSNGNCYYVGNDQDAVLIDVGISARETERRMKRSGLSFGNVKAIFISHEHIDHVTGVAGLSKRHQLPVFITNNTLRDSNVPIEPHLVTSFKAGVPEVVGTLTITPFRKSHDACDPHSFTVSDGKITVGIFTDIGHSCKQVISHFQQCHAVFLEANYCENMLMNGGYPYFLQRRISGDNGHLSNTQALELFEKYRGAQLSHLILSHLSKNNNSPELVEQLFTQKAGNIKVTVASRYKESEVYRIDGSYIDSSYPAAARQKLKYVQARPVQLSLFGN